MRGIGRKGEDTAIKNVISVIIAVMGIVLIVYGIVKVSHIFTNQEETNAKNSLDILSSRLSLLEPGEKSSFLLQGFKNSDKWVVSTWNKTEQGRPDKCFFKSCLCLCPSADNAAQSCQESGFCKTFDYDGITLEPIKAEDVPSSSWYLTYNLPTNADECKIEIVKTSSNNFARVQMNPTKHYIANNDYAMVP